MAKKQDTVRISTTLPKSLVRQIEKEAAKLRKKKLPCGPGAAIAEVVRRHFLGNHGSKVALLEAYREILSEARPLKKHGQECVELGKIREAKRSFLLAASKELEALAMLEDPSDQITNSTVIEVVHLLKDGTGFKHLPNVPGTGKTTHTIM